MDLKSLLSEWQYKADAKAGSIGLGLSFHVYEKEPGIFELVVSDEKGEVEDTYTGPWETIFKKLDRYHIDRETVKNNKEEE